MLDGGSIISNTTSFIPKTRITAGLTRTGKGAGFGLGMLVSGFILFVSLALFGGVYFYKNSLQKGIDEAVASIELARKAFEPGLIMELISLNSSINSVKIVLNQHRAPLRILDLIGNLVLKDVFFSNFAYSFDDKIVLVKMTGEAKSYAGVALQAKVFEENDAIDEVYFSGLSLKEEGKVGFSVELTVKPEFLIYKP